MLGMLEGCTCIPAGERADGEDGGVCLQEQVLHRPLWTPTGFSKTWKLRKMLRVDLEVQIPSVFRANPSFPPASKPELWLLKCKTREGREVSCIILRWSQDSEVTNISPGPGIKDGNWAGGCQLPIPAPRRCCGFALSSISSSLGTRAGWAG